MVPDRDRVDRAESRGVEGEVALLAPRQDSVVSVLVLDDDIDDRRLAGKAEPPADHLLQGDEPRDGCLQAGTLLGLESDAIGERYHSESLPPTRLSSIHYSIRIDSGLNRMIFDGFERPTGARNDPRAGHASPGAVDAATTVSMEAEVLYC